MMRGLLGNGGGSDGNGEGIFDIFEEHGINIVVIAVFIIIQKKTLFLIGTSS